MTSIRRVVLSRRGLGSLLIAAPAATRASQAGPNDPAGEARIQLEADLAKLRSVTLHRSTEPSFRFEA